MLPCMSMIATNKWQQRPKSLVRLTVQFSCGPCYSDLHGCGWVASATPVGGTVASSVKPWKLRNSAEQFASTRELYPLIGLEARLRPAVVCIDWSVARQPHMMQTGDKITIQPVRRGTLCDKGFWYDFVFFENKCFSYRLERVACRTISSSDLGWMRVVSFCGYMRCVSIVGINR